MKILTLRRIQCIDHNNSTTTICELVKLQGWYLLNRFIALKISLEKFLKADL
jgi:hypothetical protein